MLPDGDLPDNAGTVIWSSRQRMDVLGHAITFGFDQLARELGEEGYQRGWGHPFPRADLEALRKASPSPTK
jgi:hypothetical protein